MSAVPGADAGVDPSLTAHAPALTAVAEASIDHGLVHGEPLPVEASHFPAPLQAWRSAFVTLFAADGALRGCIGSLDAQRPLVAEVSANAFAAAFRDPRFPPLTAGERAGLACKLSVLTRPEPVAFSDEADLLAGLQPGIDGLLIESGECRGTFLPAVWETLPDRHAFWRELKRKAGLPDDGIPADLAVFRYRTESLG